MNQINKSNVHNFKMEIYVSMKQIVKNFEIFYLFCEILESADKILIFDIIFNFRRTFLNIYHYIYFLSPIFYFEVLNTKIAKNKNTKLDLNTYNKDQIYKMQKKYFNQNPISQLYYRDLKIYGVIYIILILICFSIHLIKSKNYITKILKMLSNIFLYFTFTPLLTLLLLLFNRKILMEFTDEYQNLDYEYILDFLLMIIFNFLAHYFYTLFIYVYSFNESYFFLRSSVLLYKFFLNEVGVIIIVFRNNNKYSILFHILYGLILISMYFTFLKTYIYNLNKKIQVNLSFFLRTFYFSFFMIRFISVFIIKYLNQFKEYKIFEIFTIYFLTFLLFFTFLKRKKSIPLSLLKKYLLKENYIFFIGLMQLFSPLIEFFEFRTKNKRLLEKYKEEFLSSYKEILQKYFCLSKDDYNILTQGNKILEIIFNNINFNNRYTSSSSQNNPQQKNFELILNILLNLQTYFYKIGKEKNNLFGSIVMEDLIYTKVLLFYITDDKTFKAEYYLQKFFYSKQNNHVFVNNNLLMNSIFYYLFKYFVSKEKKNEDTSMEYIIHFNLLSIEYLNIIKSFKNILISFDKRKKEILKIIDRESYVINDSLNKIIQ